MPFAVLADHERLQQTKDALELRASLPPNFNPTRKLYTPHGKYAFADGLQIKSVDKGFPLGTGVDATVYLKKGILEGEDCAYISKTWSIWEEWRGFFTELYLYSHKDLLRPLQGDCVSYIIGLYNIPGGRVSMAMETPHPRRWREAHPSISREIKETILTAYEKIHAQGVLHYDVALRHMLIGDDDRVTLIDFGFSKVLSPYGNKNAKLEICTPKELEMEMRQVKFMLDYDDARAIEYRRTQAADERKQRNYERMAITYKRQITQSEVDALELPEPETQEEKDFPPFTLSDLNDWDALGTSQPSGFVFAVPLDRYSDPLEGATDLNPLLLLPVQAAPKDTGSRVVPTSFDALQHTTTPTLSPRQHTPHAPTSTLYKQPIEQTIAAMPLIPESPATLKRSWAEATYEVSPIKISKAGTVSSPRLSFKEPRFAPQVKVDEGLRKLRRQPTPYNPATRTSSAPAHRASVTHPALPKPSPEFMPLPELPLSDREHYNQNSLLPRFPEVSFLQRTPPLHIRHASRQLLEPAPLASTPTASFPQPQLSSSATGGMARAVLLPSMSIVMTNEGHEQRVWQVTADVYGEVSMYLKSRTIPMSGDVHVFAPPSISTPRRTQAKELSMFSSANNDFVVPSSPPKRKASRRVDNEGDRGSQNSSDEPSLKRICNSSSRCENSSRTTSMGIGIARLFWQLVSSHKKT